MEKKLIDSHCHINLIINNDENKIKEILKIFNKKNITRFLNPATLKDDWDFLIKLNKQNNNIKIALGMHPIFIKKHSLNDLLILEEYLKRENNIKFIGEIGLDKRKDFIKNNDFENQKILFREQLKLAKKFNKKVIIHNVKSNNEILEIIKEENFLNGGIFHNAYGSYELLMQFVKYNFILGLGELLTYPKLLKFKNAVSKIDIKYFLIESDISKLEEIKLAKKDINIIFNEFCKIKSNFQIEYLQNQLDKNYLHLSNF